MRGQQTQRRADERIGALATRQHGTIGYWQLRALGLSAGAIERRAAAGRLRRLHRGVYAVGHEALSWEGRALAAVLAFGPSAVLSHRSAGRVWALRPWTGRHDVTVPGNGRGHEVDGALAHRSILLTSEDVTEVDGLPVTTVARTLIDLGEVLRRDDLERVLEQADRRRLDLGDFDAVLDRHAARAGARRIHRAREHLRLGDTSTREELERRFLALCRRHRLPSPSVNTHVLGMSVDFAWHDERLIVETDGWAFHGTRAAFERDRERDVRLSLEGYRVLRFTWRQVTGDERFVVRALRAHLR